MSLTGVDPDADCETLRGHVAYFEALDGAQEMQSHRADLQSVLVAVADRQTAGHHVRITDRFHLAKMEEVKAPLCLYAASYVMRVVCIELHSRPVGGSTARFTLCVSLS